MSRSTGPAGPRYEREIEQMLCHSRVGRRRWRLPRPRLRFPALRWDWQTGALLGWVLVAAAFVLRYVSAPWAPRTGRWLVLVGTMLVVLSYFAPLSRSRPRYEKRWRGEIIDLPRPEPSWRRALHRLFRRR